MAKPFSELQAALTTKKTAETNSSSSPQPKQLANEDKLKALKAVEAQLNKQFNTTASIVRLGSKASQPLPALSTGLYTFDYDVVGIGGIPRGRIIELIGPESSGKTTFALHCAAEEQKRGELVYYVDVEHALDTGYMKNLGV